MILFSWNLHHLIFQGGGGLCSSYPAYHYDIVHLKFSPSSNSQVGVGLVLATLLWWVSNTFLLKPAHRDQVQFN